ncbi:MAG: M12 family metallopeptidase [Spirochaetaceae bacterium]|jgi:astacin|nr:M12 family metallopeptidase [Spirochaetaceae bacterium]
MDRNEVFSAKMKKGVVKKGYLYLYTEELVPVEYTEINRLAVYQGDIILGTAAQMTELTEMVNSTNDIGERKRLTSNIVTASGKTWPDNQIVYDLDNSVRDNPLILNLILAALIKFTNSKTPMKIRERTGKDKNYICFYKSTGCSSYVGMRGGSQPVNISERAVYGNVIHEVCHAAGLWHEHSRKDRDGYIIIDTANIRPEALANFDITKTEGRDSGDYDYGSIMHYGAYAFAKDKKYPTITPNQSAEIGQREHLSAGDIAGLEALYPALPKS